MCTDNMNNKTHSVMDIFISRNQSTFLIESSVSYHSSKSIFATNPKYSKDYSLAINSNNKLETNILTVGEETIPQAIDTIKRQYHEKTTERKKLSKANVDALLSLE